MKAKLEYCLQWLRDGAVRVARSYPIETLLALYACVWCLLTYELDWSEGDLFKKLALVPLFFALALAVNNLAGRGPWRKVYWVVWAPIVPLTLWIGLGDWIEGASYRISLGILAPLLLLLSLWAVRNDRFVNGALVWLRSAARPADSPTSRWDSSMRYSIRRPISSASTARGLNMSRCGPSSSSRRWPCRCCS